MQQTVNLNNEPDMSVLKVVMGRLIKTEAYTNPLLALEIIDGPYKGVTFWFSKFHADLEKIKDGMTPITFETQIYEAPDGFTSDEAFDEFCGEVFFAWLAYIQQYDMAPFLKVKPEPGIH